VNKGTQHSSGWLSAIIRFNCAPDPDAVFGIKHDLARRTLETQRLQ
jgi:hypothetical protein